METTDMIKTYRIGLVGEKLDMLAVRKPPTGKTAADEISALRAAKPEILTVLQARQAEENARFEAARSARQAELDATEAPLIDAMNTEADRLRSLIPAGEVEVTITETGNSDGYPILEYAVGGVEVSYRDVTVIGWASATRPGAMASFRSVCIASISRDKLAEIKEATEAKAAEKIAAENQAKEALAQKFSEASTTGNPVEIKRYMAECYDPAEECNTDIVTVYAMPDGSTKTERQHTW